MEINFLNETNKDFSEAESIILEVFSQFSSVNKLFNIIFVDDEKIHEINKTYRGVDRVTDVISFALNDSEEITGLPEESLELGDIFIDISQAERQAKLYNHSLKREIAFLSVHGYLHLCGYDHMKKEDEEIMTKKQEEILNKVNIRRELV